MTKMNLKEINLKSRKNNPIIAPNLSEISKYCVDKNTVNFQFSHNFGHLQMHDCNSQI